VDLLPIEAETNNLLKSFKFIALNSIIGWVSMGNGRFFNVRPFEGYPSLFAAAMIPIQAR
jgi:hypothetical protein